MFSIGLPFDQLEELNSLSQHSSRLQTVANHLDFQNESSLATEEKLNELSMISFRPPESGDENPLPSSIVSDVPLFPLFTRPVFPGVCLKPVLVEGSVKDMSFKKMVEKITVVAEKSKSTQQNNQKQNVLSTQTNFLPWPVAVYPKSFIQAIAKLKSNGEHYVVLSLAKNVFKTVNKYEDIYDVGVLASIEVGPEKNGNIELSLKVSQRVRILDAVKISNQEPSFLKVAIRPLIDEKFADDEIDAVRSDFAKLVAAVNDLQKFENPLFKYAAETLSEKAKQENFSSFCDICATLCTAVPQILQVHILQELNVHRKIKKMFILMTVERNKLVQDANKSALSPSLRSGANSPFGNGKNSKVISEFKERAKKLNMPENVKKVFEEELAKLEGLDPNMSGAEHYLCKNYLNWLVSLPWGIYSNDNLDLVQAEQILEEDHYEIRDVKERILEFISVGFLKKNLSGKIILLVGPPGVGKTSIAKSIARAVNRKFFRFSVGGTHDVSEIKGHRRTYVGALPGKFIQAMKNAQTSNPVILIDEIDKLGRGGLHGDPSSALLEALDPEQNSQFLDQYIDIPFDLSKVLFVCTANTTQTIPRPLLDRMEIIKLSGYFLDEKLVIAKKHIIPKIRNECGIQENQFSVEEAALVKMIGQYCREAGVRSLQKNIEKLLRKVAKLIATNEVENVSVTAENLSKFLGPPPHYSDKMFTNQLPSGVVIGLAYNEIGGSLVWIESVVVDMNKGKLKTTGKLGSVMKESVDIAFTLARKYLFDIDSTNTFFEKAHIHIHFPEGAIPKDGPSAGCAITTSFLSLALNHPLKPNWGMTGEVSLTGKVLAVGGIKEKLMAAKRNDVNTIILPEANKRDFEELPELLKDGLTIHFVGHYSEVFQLIFDPLGDKFHSSTQHIPTSRL